MNKFIWRYGGSSLKPKRGRPFAGWFLAIALLTSSSFPGFLGPLKSIERTPEPSRAGQAEETCLGGFQSISQPLNDLGPGEYIRPVQKGGWFPTGYYGGLYPDGENVRPPAHEAAGVSVASQIQSLDASGQPDPADGRIVMISVGMSNTSQEFLEFIEQVEGEPAINPQLVVVNGAQPGITSDEWVDPNATPWDVVDERLAAAGVTPAQVQVAWVKQTRVGIGAFPSQAITIEGDLETIARNLLIRYPNIKIAYYSSRTRAYTYWSGLSPEPAAFENGFSVKWMIQKQINGDPALNFATPGPVVAPFLSWGPYLWADGPNPRSDGFTWLAEDLQDDCTHPSGVGEEKIACLLMGFFSTDTTAAGWFMDEPVPAYCHRLFIPAVASNQMSQTGAVSCEPWLVAITRVWPFGAYLRELTCELLALPILKDLTEPDSSYTANAFSVIPGPESQRRL